MAKIEKASEEMIKQFNEVKGKSTIKDWLEFEVFCNNKQKELYKIVKTNDLVEILSNGINFAVIFNEEIFDQLPKDMQVIAINECLAGVMVDENDKISLEKPNFSTYRGILEKYGHDPIIVLHESIKSLYDKKKQDEDAQKAAKKEKRGKSKAFPKSF